MLAEGPSPFHLIRLVVRVALRRLLAEVQNQRVIDASGFCVPGSTGFPVSSVTDVDSEPARRRAETTFVPDPAKRTLPHNTSVCDRASAALSMANFRHMQHGRHALQLDWMSS